MGDPNISIVICTYRRPELLRLALESLAQQEKYPSGSIEIIVVDNDFQPNPHVQEITSQFEKYLPVIYIHEPRIGLSFARNTGGQAARAEYIGYLDDDAKANPAYIARLLEILKTYGPDICGGPFYPFYLEPRKRWFKDAYGTCFWTDKPGYFMKREYLPGMNIILQKKLLTEMGWFDPNYGMSGKNISYGEETLLQMKAWEAHPDLKMYYDPDLFVYHLVPSRKMTIAWRLHMAYALGKSEAYIWIRPGKIKEAQKRALYTLIIVFLRIIFKSLPGAFFRDRVRYPFWQNYAYEIWWKDVNAVGQEIQLCIDFYHIHHLNKGSRKYDSIQKT